MIRFLCSYGYQLRGIDKKVAHPNEIQNTFVTLLLTTVSYLRRYSTKVGTFVLLFHTNALKKTLQCPDSHVDICGVCGVVERARPEVGDIAASRSAVRMCGRCRHRQGAASLVYSFYADHTRTASSH